MRWLRELSAALSAACAGRRRLAYLPLLLLVAGCAAQPKQGYTGSLIWQVEKEGYARSYVLGTIHSADPRLFDMRPEVRQALGEADIAAFEVLKDEAGEEQLQQAMRQPVGGSLEDVLDGELFERTATAVSRYGISRDLLRGLKPFALVPLLAYPREELARAMVGEPVLDVWLQFEARRQGKSLRSLESYEEQISLFDDMGSEDQAALICELVAAHPNAEAQFARQLDAYFSGDILALLTAAQGQSAGCDPAAAARFQARLLDDRNRKMVARILPLLKESSTFIAVGALHLPGETGILTLLARKGFTITRLH